MINLMSYHQSKQNNQHGTDDKVDQIFTGNNFSEQNFNDNTIDEN